MAVSPPKNPASGPRDGAIALAIAVLAIFPVLVGQLAPGPTRDNSASATQAAPTEDTACAEWSNGCRVCIRRADGPACSLPGIACTPGASACTRRGDAP